ncbi:hypothetical protein JCM16303_003209 [Sporobolomyces ruberrimus]
MNFSTFATSLLQSTSAGSNQHSAPLFYPNPSPEHAQTRGGTKVVEEDILGESYEDDHDRIESGADYDSESDIHSSPDPSPQSDVPKSALGLSNVVPAFITRLGAGTGGGGGGATSRSRSGATRGWKAYESLAATRQFPRGHDLTASDLSEEDEGDEGPLPGTFVSQATPPGPPERHAMNEPLIGRRTLFVYPGQTNLRLGVNSPSRELYRDSTWIAIYGLSLAVTLFVSFKAYFADPSPTSSPPPSTHYTSLISTTPLFLTLSLLSLFTSSLALSLLLILRRTLRPLLTLSIFVGPFLFSLIGVIAFFGSFGQRGVERDKGWKVGMRVFALGCVAMSWLLGRASIKRRTELNRAILVGELACQTIVHHPPLILLALVLSFISTILSLPFLTLITSLLSLAPSHPKLAGFGSSFVLFDYVWTLAMLRGIGKATTSGVVGSWYFEGQEREAAGGEGDVSGGSTRTETTRPSTVHVTQAAFARATGPSLGSILFSSLLTTLLQTLSSLLGFLSRTLRRASLPQFLSPLVYLIPICEFLAGWANWYNGYTTVYVGLTGKTASESAKEVAGVMFANRASNIRDTTLLRLLLSLALSPLTLLPSLISFLILSSSYLSPYSGGYAPMLAVLSVIVPAWTGRVVLGLVTDAVDTLFIATHLDAENEEKSCQKAVEAFGEPERDTLANSLA